MMKMILGYGRECLQSLFLGGCARIISGVATKPNATDVSKGRVKSCVVKILPRRLLSSGRTICEGGDNVLFRCQIWEVLQGCFPFLEVVTCGPSGLIRV